MMAGAYPDSDSDIGLSDSQVLPQYRKKRELGRSSPTKTPLVVRGTPSTLLKTCDGRLQSSAKRTALQSTPGLPRQRKIQRPLGQAQDNPLLRPITGTKIDFKDSGFEAIDLPVAPSPTKSRSSPRKSLKPKVKYYAPKDESSDVEVEESEDGGDSDGAFDDFIVNDSESESELYRPAKKPAKGRTQSRRKTRSKRIDDTDSEAENVPSETIELVVPDSPEKSQRSARLQSQTKGEQNSSQSLDEFFEEPGASLKFSPPTRKQPYDTFLDDVFVTPPSTPTKSTVASPSRLQSKIPPSPHRPSIDAFWDQGTTNEWNDLHSPQKSVKSVKVIPIDDEDSDFPSPSASPRKSPTKTPAKKDKATAEKKKAFQSNKDEIARAFVAELDNEITSGQISALAETTGGIHLKWSKTLNTTAGRANWKKESKKTTNSADGTSSVRIKHHASIELAEKVIDDENRLLNVLAHEFCHLANFMISGVKNQPHGKEFKAWAAKVTKAFANRGVEVTTKHSYAIDYKYVWECTECGIEYKRHSKSIDPARHTCGGCKSKLKQTKPVPRGKSGKEDEYRKFVKANYNRVRDALPEEERKGGMGKVMAQLAKEYRALKGEAAAEKIASSSPVPEEAEVVQLIVEESDDEVAGKLQSMTLG